MSKKKDEARASAVREHFQKIAAEAKSLPEADALAILVSDGKQVADYFLLGESLFAALVCYWQNGNLMTYLIEDTVCWIAVKLFLLKQGAQVFKSSEELREHAIKENWPNAHQFLAGRK